MSGGGGSSSAPTNQTVTNTSIPEYARPYAEGMLGQTNALTDINKNPYQPYQGQQVAGFSPMQAQGMTGIANQQVAPQITDASNFAFQSGAGGLGAYQNSAALQNASLGYGSQGNQFAIQNANLANQYAGQGNQFAIQNANLANQYAGQGASSAAVNAALANSYAGAGAQGAFANADLINAYGGEAFKSGQLGQQLGVEGGAKFGNMGSAFGQQGADIGTTGGAYYGGQGMNYGAQGANLAGANLGVGMTGMQAGLGYGQGAQNPYAVQGYMNPYLQASLQPQLAEMQRQYGISGAQGQSNATKAGAFGGSREALIFAENQRNKNIAMNQAIGQGYNTAYDVANKNMQAAASLGMQGAGVGLQGLQGANQNYLTGLQGAQTGLQGVNTQLAGTAQGMQGAQVGLAGVDRQLAGTAQGMQGASLGMQGANQAGQLMIGGGQLGLQGAQTAGNMGIAGANLGLQGAQVAGNMGIAGANLGLQGAQVAGNLGISGSNAGMQGVQGAVGAGQYGLAGLGLAGSAGSTLGALGQTQFGQQQAINQAQMQAGAQQQALQQQGLNVAYQQYQDQMNYPYKQLAFQSDMMRGLPLSQSSQTMYQNTGAMAPQLLGAGIAAYGATNKGAKEGGLMSYARGGAVQGYAMGGQPVDPRAVAATSPAALSSKLAQLTDGQLQAYARTVKDAVALAEVKSEMARRAGVRQPQGEMPTQTVAQEIAGQGGVEEQPMMAAGGGIVALARGSEEPVKEDYERGMYDNPEEANIMRRRATVRGTQAESNRQAAANTAADLERPSVTEDERQAFIDFGRSTDSQYAEADRVRAAQAMAPNVDSQVQPGMVDRNTLIDAEMGQDINERQSQLERQTAAAQVAAQESGLPKDRNPSGIAVIPPTGAYGAPAGGGITAVPPVAGVVPVVATSVVPSASGVPAGGGITDVGTPAGGAPRTGGTTAPVNAMTPRTPGAGGHGTTIGSTGAGVPVGVPGDPLSFTTYRATVEDMAKLDPEDKATLANMQARTEKRLRRAEGQEKNVMNDAFVSAGLAMMSGLNLSDGIKRAAEAGGKQYFSSQAEARKAIDKAEEAQDAFDQYRTALKQGNKKLANEMYGTFFKSYADVYGKVTAAGITAGAHDRSTAENRAARLQMHDTETARRTFEHSETIRVREAQIEQNSQQFKERMTQLGDTAKANDFDRLQSLKQQAITNAAGVEQKIRESFQKDPRYYSLSMVPESQLKPAQLKERRIMEAELADRIAQATKPFNTEINNVINRQSTLMGLTSIQPNSGGARTYNRATGQLE
jgi:hypothetical protein